MLLSVRVNLTEKSRSLGFSGGQKVRREVSSEAKPWAAASIGRGAGEGVLLTARRCGVPRRVMGRAKWGAEGSYGRGYERAREQGCEGRSDGRERVFLAGPMRVCSHPKSRGSGILRSVLRSPLRPVLRSIFHAALRNRGHQRVERAGKLAQDTAWRPWRRWVSASDSTLLTTE